MSGFVPSWLGVAQCLVAGIVLGLCGLHWSAWRGDMRRAGTGWTLGWSLVLAAVCVVDGLLAFTSSGPTTETLLVVRFVALAAAVVISLPAVHAYTRGPGVRGLVTVTAAWYAVAAALWIWTDVIYAHRLVDGLPLYGPLATAVNLVPVALVGLYVARGARDATLTLVGGVVTVCGFVSATLLIAASVAPPSALTETLRGVWALPMIVGLQVLAAGRISQVRREAHRRAQMREAVAAVANAAWFVRSPEEVLVRARDECRLLLDDPAIEGSLRPLAKDRFVTEFYSPGGRAADADARAFMRDLARVVSGAAQRHTLTARLQQAASTDSLTQLHNRHALDRHLSAALESADVNRTRVAVLFGDLDGFKVANDRHGHEWGDRLLIRTADHFRRTLADDAFVARHGGDEFVAVLGRAPHDGAIRDLARRLRAEFSAPGDESVGAPTLTVGFVTREPGEPVDAATLVRHADHAMLEAKRSRSGVAQYGALLRSRVDAQTALRRALEVGIGDGDIVAHFQPLTDATSLEIVGLEALARWRRDGRLRRPAEWLPFAEESGLIVEVGRQVLRAARVGMERFDLPVAVNVAARQLDEPDFVDQVELGWGEDAWDRLTIEVTESALLYDAAHVRSSLATLAERGVRIAIDDFGTGYNSLSRLGELPLHILKIDRTFVQDIRSPEGAAVLRAIIALAQAHELEIIAEGVEHIDELEALIDMGVDIVQGHMLGRPAATLPLRGTRSRWAAARAQLAERAVGGTTGPAGGAGAVTPAVSV